jgi:hypothetical protein
MRTRKLLAVVCIALVTTATAGSADSTPVGSLGRPGSLVIEGAKTFSPDEIREELFNDLDVVAAGRPEALLVELTAVIAKKTAAGYRDAGFCDAAVSVVAADDKLVMTIVEGMRFTNGEILVSGTRQLDAEKIIGRFAGLETNGLKHHSLWQEKEPASFSPEMEARLTSRALLAAEDQGCYRATLNAMVKPNQDTGQATLHIHVSDEGELSTLGDVELTGNARNSREVVIAYLGLDVAVPLTRQRRDEIERRLLASGRFTEVRWELDKPEERGASWRPHLAMQEYELAPLLGQPLSREEDGLLKLAEWFERLEDSNEEILLQTSNGEIAIVFVPPRGLIVLFKCVEDDAAADDMSEFTYAMVLDEERMAFYSGSQHRKLVAQPPPSPVIGEVEINLVNGIPEWDGASKLRLGIGLSSEVQKGYRRHIKVQLKLTAPAALSLLYKHKAACHWDGDVLCLEWDKHQMRLNALTGKLIEHVVKMDSQVDGAHVTDRLAVKPGEFDRRLREIETPSAGWPNVVDPRRALSCAGEFLCADLERLNAYILRHADDDRQDYVHLGEDLRDSEFASQFYEEIVASRRENSAKSQRSFAALRKAISLGLLEPFDRLILEAVQPSKEGFSVPLPPFNLRLRSLEEFTSIAREAAPLFGVRVGNFLFPSDGWMNDAWRLGLFAAGKKRMILRDALPPLHGNKRGPLGTLAAAELLRVAGADFESKIWALRRSRDPAVVAFREECKELVSGEGFVSQLLLNTADVSRQLNAAEAEALTQLFVELDLLSGPQAAALELAILRAQAEDSPRKAAVEALNALWRAGLETWIEQRLDTLGGTSQESADH